MKYFVILFIITIISSQGLSAQPDSGNYDKVGGYMTAGVHFTDFSTLNSDLRNHGLPEIDETQLALGAGGGIFIGRWYFGGQGVGQFNGSSSNALYQTRYNSGYGFVEGGFAVVQTPEMALYPTLGLGGGGGALQIERNSDIQGTDVVFTDNSMSEGYMLVDVGLNSDVFIGIKKDRTQQVVLGISAGYQWHPFISQWNYTDQALTGFEKFSPNGFYLKLKIGWMTLIDNAE